MIKYIDCFNNGDIKEKNCKYKNIIWHFADNRVLYKNIFNDIYIINCINVIIKIILKLLKRNDKDVYNICKEIFKIFKIKEVKHLTHIFYLYDICIKILTYDKKNIKSFITEIINYDKILNK
jgi:hypothetical protein